MQKHAVKWGSTAGRAGDGATGGDCESTAESTGTVRSWPSEGGLRSGVAGRQCG